MQVDPSGANNKARSNLPEDLRPALIPEALKPCGVVIPPVTCVHKEEGEALKRKNEYAYLYCTI